MKKVKMSSIFTASLLAVCLLIIAACVSIAADLTMQGRTGGGNYEMVHVPGGSFQMGNNDFIVERVTSPKPLHTVTLSAFSIGKYEVTQALYESVMGYNPSYFNGFADSSKRPVEQVTWYDALEFCNKLSEKERLQPVYAINDRKPATGYPITSATVVANWSKNGYRLPTEAQWEYAAKGGNGSPGNYTYSGSNNIDEVAWYGENSGGAPQVVGTKTPNELGIYDMSGNVWELCWDWYGDYSSEAQTDPLGASSGPGRVDRGGSWLARAQYSHSAHRGYLNPFYRSYFIGFRVVRPAQ